MNRGCFLFQILPRPLPYQGGVTFCKDFFSHDAHCKWKKIKKSHQQAPLPDKGGAGGGFGDLDASDLLSASVSSDRHIADPTMTALLNRGIDLRNVSTAPASIRIPSKDDTIVTWQNISGSDAPIIRAAFGKTISIPALLPDQTAETMLSAPTSTDDDSQLIFHTNLSASSTDYTSSFVHACEGSLLYEMQGDVMTNTLQLLHLPQSWIDRLSGLMMTRDGKEVRVCVEVK